MTEKQRNVLILVFCILLAIPKSTNALSNVNDATTKTCHFNFDFMCGSDCKSKAANKVCNGNCIKRSEICGQSDKPCEVPHEENAIDWKCGKTCRNDVKREESIKFDCGGKCIEKSINKECGNGICLERNKLCSGDEDPCEIRHEQNATDWKCGTKCRKEKEETSSYIDCAGKCEFKNSLKKCCNSKYQYKTQCAKKPTDSSIKAETTNKIVNAEIDDKTNKDGDESNKIIISVAVVSVLILITAASLAVFLIQKKKKKLLNTVYLKGDIPEHRILKKNDDLLDIISQAAKEKSQNKEEFKALQEYVRVNIVETTNIGQDEENKDRNRYMDVLPYDSNIISLKKPTGVPPLTYINASIITFPDLTQTFIAAQAPKLNTLSSFWQMILDQEVTTIVMITGLVEGRKTKADKYWPDMEDPDMELDNGIKLRYLSHSFPGTYYHRRLVVTDSNGKERYMNQLQTTACLDMTAPKDTKVWLDLVYKAQDLLGDPNTGEGTSRRKSISPKSKRNKKAPIVVHCSAGVGRTGTFIALYKLVADYNNDKVKDLDVFSTVVRMREQRMNMVQKHQQYSYIIKCLHHYIVAQTDIYQA